MSKQTPVLLVVDDRPDNLFIIEQLAHEYIPSCVVHTAPNADAAFQMALEKNPDGILSDIQMPGRNGIELCRQLKETPETMQIPVLLITAHKSNPNLLVQGLEAGADDFIARPIDNLELAARIKVMFRIKHVQDELLEAKHGLEQKVSQRTADLSKANEELKNEIVRRKHTQDELLKNQYFLQKAQEIGQIGTWDFDIKTNKLLWTDENYRIFGIPIGTELTYEMFMNCIHPDDREYVDKQWKVSFDKKFYDIEHRLLVDGEIKWVREKAELEFNDKGECVRGTGVAQDVTERKQTENEKKSLEAQLQQAQKMETIGTLAGGIAHDFNNILFPLVGYTEMLLEDVPEDSPFRENLAEIYTSAMRAKDLVQQILTFSRHEKHETKLMKIQPIVKETVKMIRSTIPSTIEVTLNMGSHFGIINADPTHVHQLMMNLLTNAYHAIGDEVGQLKVEIKEVELSNFELMTPRMVPGIYNCITVSDTGAGIDDKTKKRIFEPFFTTKEKGKGTGMGLSVVHGIVESMAGGIQISTELGKGTEFSVYIPVVKSSVKEHSAQAKESVPGGTEKILLIDDEETIIRMENKVLQRLGYQITSCTDSIKALEVFSSSPGKFDLVITDFAMPDMPGDKLAAKLIEIRSDIPILLCTGYSKPMSEAKAISMGIKGFLNKPIGKRNLALKIREVLDENK